MANISGNSGLIKIGANTIAEVLDFTISRGAATMDNSALDDDDDTHLVGSKNWNASINAFYDSTDANGQEAMKAGDAVTLILQPEGDVSGDVTLTGLVTIESTEIGVSRNATTPISFTAKGNGALTEGTIA